MLCINSYVWQSFGLKSKNTSQLIMTQITFVTVFDMRNLEFKSQKRQMTLLTYLMRLILSLRTLLKKKKNHKRQEVEGAIRKVMEYDGDE